MALSNKKIKGEIENGNIIISPYEESNLNTSSYDVRLGEYYFRENKLKDKLFYNFYDEEQVKNLWGEPQKALPSKEIFAETPAGIYENEKIILINPGETILGHTDEFIGGKNHITTMMKARSSLGRNFIQVCKCAGWGDVGFTNRWAMEISNSSQEHTIALVVGRRISQIVFFETGDIEGDDYTKSGKYQTTEDIKKLKKEWDPYSLVPKTYNDKEVNKIVDNCYKNAKKILKEHRSAMDALVKTLLEVETLEREEYEKLLKENNVVIKNHHDIHHKG